MNHCIKPTGMAAATEKLMLYYGKFTAPAGSPSDFTHVVLYTMETHLKIGMRINGDRVTNIIAE